MVTLTAVLALAVVLRLVLPERVRVTVLRAGAASSVPSSADAASADASAVPAAAVVSATAAASVTSARASVS